MKKMYLLFLALIVVAIVIGFAVRSGQKATTYKHYQNSGEVKFSFDYPTFEGWDVEIKTGEIRYTPDPSLSLQIEYPPVVKIETSAKSDSLPKTTLNPQKVPYTTSSASGDLSRLVFFLTDTQITLLIPRSLSYPNFSGETLWSTILSSFSRE